MENHIRRIETYLWSQPERQRLIGLCARISGRPDVAEDLAQETLFLAWRHLEKLRDKEKQQQWIAGIARNVCLQWLRDQKQITHHQVAFDHSDKKGSDTWLTDIVADDFDLEVELERRELVTLLDRALALLPFETRQVLIKRYVDESPLAEIAEQLSTNTGTIAMRLQRGKLALRKILATDLQAEVEAYTGDVSETLNEWESTSLWCHRCGKHRLLGKKDAEQGLLYLKCPHCSSNDGVVSKNELSILKGIKSYKPAYTRLVRWCHSFYRQGLHVGEVPCDTCGRKITARITGADNIRELAWLNKDVPRWLPPDEGPLLAMICHHCSAVSCITLDGLVLALPEGRQFIRKHPQVHMLPTRSIEYNGRPALVSHFESILDSANFEVISDAVTFEVLNIHGGVQ